MGNYIYILPYMDRCITNSISRFTGEVDIGNKVLMNST